MKVNTDQISPIHQNTDRRTDEKTSQSIGPINFFAIQQNVKIPQKKSWY